jgi:hypothetical protein
VVLAKNRPTLILHAYIGTNPLVPTNLHPNVTDSGCVLHVTPESKTTTRRNIISFSIPTTTMPDQTDQSIDKFGVAKVFADGVGSSWYLGDSDDPNTDPRVKNPETDGNEPKLTKNTDGSFNILNKIEVRYAVAATNFDETKISACTPTCQKQGYMQDPSDWKDIEQTAYYRLKKLHDGKKNGGPHIEHVMRGQRSTSETKSYGGCSSSCSNNYHLHAHFDGRQKYEKDLDHTTDYWSKQPPDSEKQHASGNWPMNQWVGFKTIVYNKGDGVQLETWTDIKGNGEWVMTHNLFDSGHWPVADASTVQKHCKTSGQPPITWGGPLTVFRSDNIEDYDIKWASIRSIDSSKRLHSI